MSRTEVQDAANRLRDPNYVPAVNEFKLGKEAAKRGVAPQAHWPERMVAGWQSEVGRKLQGGER